MKTVKISLNSIDKVKAFVNDITKFDYDFDLVSGRYVIDAKSIMGIFSLDLSKPIDLNIHAEDNIDAVMDVIKAYVVDGVIPEAPVFEEVVEDDVVVDETVEATEEACVLKAKVTKNSLNPYGIAHGGFIFGLGDTVLGMNLMAGGHLTHGHPLNFSGSLPLSSRSVL